MSVTAVAAGAGARGRSGFAPFLPCQLERVESVFERLAERPLLPFREELDLAASRLGPAVRSIREVKARCASMDGDLRHNKRAGLLGRSNNFVCANSIYRLR